MAFRILFFRQYFLKKINLQNRNDDHQIGFIELVASVVCIIDTQRYCKHVIHSIFEIKKMFVFYIKIQIALKLYSFYISVIIIVTKTQ